MFEVSPVRTMTNLFLFGLFTLGFLGSVRLFLGYRLRQAGSRGEVRYVPHADPWLPAVMALAGLAVIALLGLIR